MIDISDQQFAELIERAMDELPKAHMRAVKNVAIIYEEEPTERQRQELKLQCDQTLFGLYEGVPLTKRQGRTGYGPDKITIFKGPITRDSSSPYDLRAHIKKTIWHEIAHYFGLDHDQIHRLERP